MSGEGADERWLSGEFIRHIRMVVDRDGEESEKSFVVY